MGSGIIEFQVSKERYYFCKPVIATYRSSVAQPGSLRQLDRVRLTVLGAREAFNAGKRYVDAWKETSENSQTSQSLFGKPVKRSLRAVFLLCKLKCFVEIERALPSFNFTRERLHAGVLLAGKI